MRALRPMSQEPEQNIFLKAKLDISHHMMLYPASLNAGTAVDFALHIL